MTAVSKCVVGVPPPRFVRPPGLPPSVPPPTLQAPPAAGANPGVLSAPPTIMKPPQRATPAASEDSGRRETTSATIEAKPQIRHVIGDVTRFMPTALRVKREMKDAKGHVIKPAAATAPQLPGVTPLMLLQLCTFITSIWLQFLKCSPEHYLCISRPISVVF